MTKIRGGVIGTPDSRSEDKVFGILSENFSGKFVTNIVRETSPVTFLFIGSGRKVGRGFVRVNSVVHRFPEGKMKRKTDVWSLSCQAWRGQWPSRAGEDMWLRRTQTYWRQRSQADGGQPEEFMILFTHLLAVPHQFAALFWC